jgi:outer membrane protein assembly factor BamB
MTRPLAAVLVLLTGLPAGAQEWTRFRGPNGAGVSAATTIPIKWTPEDYHWRVKLPGTGHSCPVLWGEKLFLTSCDTKTGKRIVLCLNAVTGDTVWKREFEAIPYPKHERNSFASATPTVDGRHVYVSWATPKQFTVMALDHDGNPKWEKPLGPYTSRWGHGASLVLFEDLLIVTNEQRSGSVLALKTATGDTAWSLTRPARTKSYDMTYATPCVHTARDGTGELILSHSEYGITAVNPRTGRTTWEAAVFGAPLEDDRSIASPVIAGDLVLVTCGQSYGKKRLVAVRPGDSKKGIKPVEVWRLDKGVSYLGTPLVVGDRVFLCSELGIATWLKAASGEVVWQERLRGAFSASPVCAGRAIYCVTDKGDVLVLAAADKFELLARNSVGDSVQATPAIARGCLYVRTGAHLISLGGKK